jgi:hypothetical protein
MEVLTMGTSKFNWDMTTWETAELLRWRYAIELRSDSVIHEAMDTDDWSDHDSDERTHRKIVEILKSRGLNHEGKPLSESLHEK